MILMLKLKLDVDNKRGLSFENCIRVKGNEKKFWYILDFM